VAILFRKPTKESHSRRRIQMKGATDYDNGNETLTSGLKALLRVTKNWKSCILWNPALRRPVLRRKRMEP